MTLVLVAGHWAERTDGRKNLFKREKNLPVVILSFREQTLTNIIQGVTNHLTWEKDGKGTCTPPARRAETLPQEAHSQRNLPQGLGTQHCYRHWAQAMQQQQAQPRSISAENTGIATAPLHSCRVKARVVKRHKERKPYA